MNKEQQQIIDEAYENYSREYEKDNSIGMFLPVARVDGKHTYRKIDKEMFIGLCIHDETFSEKWGLKIEERELSLEERMDLSREKRLYSWTWQNWSEEEMEWRMNNDWNIPTRLITITYKEQTITSYE